MSEEDRGLNVMQVQQHQPSHYIANNQLHDATFGTQRATTFEGAFEVLLSTTDALLAKPQRLPATFHAIAQPNLTQQPQPINIATNDFKNNQPIHSHKEEPSLSCKGNQL